MVLLKRSSKKLDRYIHTALRLCSQLPLGLRQFRAYMFIVVRPTLVNKTTNALSITRSRIPILFIHIITSSFALLFSVYRTQEKLLSHHSSAECKLSSWN
ncbi:hypothetical protein AVEN_85001-1 [Araneus ventricosus]|uniref:Uncharacterized protein n=1 Tax=Araneus ventricosus TaxID=182803 RepID=A0A4Y2C0R3_ARAVE|nr:hypothetical protein AVEN_85001-1 [Araneus ventricosus]